MPAHQGVITWPAGGPYRAALVQDHNLPVCDESADLVFAVHSLEMSEATHELLREIWRILSPEGHLVMIVPNRRGVWARIDNTPFGHGRPYSRGQLDRLLVGSMFEPLTWKHALFMPPRMT